MMCCKFRIPIVTAEVFALPPVPVPHGVKLRRHGCEHCSPRIQENQTVSFLCTLTPCHTEDHFSIGFYVIDSPVPVAIHTNTTHTFFPNGSSVVVTHLDNCEKLLTFVMSEPLNGKVLQCIAEGYYHRHRVPSVAHLLAMEGMFVRM